MKALLCVLVMCLDVAAIEPAGRHHQCQSTTTSVASAAAAVASGQIKTRSCIEISVVQCYSSSSSHPPPLILYLHVSLFIPNNGDLNDA